MAGDEDVAHQSDEGGEGHDKGAGAHGGLQLHAQEGGEHHQQQHAAAGAHEARAQSQWSGRKTGRPPHLRGWCAWARNVLRRTGAPVRLAVYRRSGLDWGAPCLKDLHGGEFCLRDMAYIHRHAAQYAQGAGCVVVFVHYRTADAAPFPVPFDEFYAALD